MGERELAEDTGLARSAYMSSESALRAELLPDDAEDTEDTLLTLSDLDTDGEGGVMDRRRPKRPTTGQ